MDVHDVPKKVCVDGEYGILPNACMRGLFRSGYGRVVRASASIHRTSSVSIASSRGGRLQ
jgi:hypothetical protein